MIFYFDTEFLEDGRTIEPISIGIVSANGDEYYAEVQEMPHLRIKGHPWLMNNVVPYLQGGEYIKPKRKIASEIVDFVGVYPEFWAYYSAYDWVLLCQLYGTMLELPSFWPMFCRDIKVLADDTGVDLHDLSQDDAHFALGDARWNRLAHQYISAQVLAGKRKEYGN